MGIIRGEGLDVYQEHHQMASRKNKGVSLAKGPVAILGIASLAYGILGLVLGGNAFSGISFPSGTVNGESFLGIEGNGWTNLLFIAAGALLLFGSPLHWGAKTMGIVVGLALGAASVIAIVDGEDVLGIFAANGLTKLVWGAGSVALLLLSLLPRVGGEKRENTRARDRDRVRADRDRDLDMVPPRGERGGERDLGTSSPRGDVDTTPRRGDLDSPPRRFERDVEREPAEREFVDREPVSTRDEQDLVAPDEGPSGTRRFAPADQGESGERRVVAPADGDGPSDHGRNGR